MEQAKPMLKRFDGVKYFFVICRLFLEAVAIKTARRRGGRVAERARLESVFTET